MIYEKLKFRFDLNLLVEHFRTQVLPLPPVTTKSICGWSVLSSDGHYTDGWHSASSVMNQSMSAEELTKNIVALGGKSTSAYVKPTEICTGYLAEVIKTFQIKGFQPTRARISRLQPQQTTTWHKDAPENLYCARIHVPLVTNKDCFFETEIERDHLSADGSAYILFVNRLHRAVNFGDADRYHLIMDATDSQSQTQFHNIDFWRQNLKREAV